MSKPKRAIAILALSAVAAIAASLGVGVAVLMLESATLIKTVGVAAGIGAIWGAIAGSDVLTGS